jgi:hypothetical protein
MSSELLAAERGRGPLLQRDYWAVIDRCHHDPAGVMRNVSRWFPRFAPAELVVFTCPDRELREGDELGVRIRGVPLTGVRVIHTDACSLTLATLGGHPEAGRITFGSYRNDRGDVLFHIRSRARSGSRFHRAGFLFMGESMQTRTWGDFVNRVAAALGEGVIGHVYAVTRRVEDEDRGRAEHAPTFLAREG